MDSPWCVVTKVQLRIVVSLHLHLCMARQHNTLMGQVLRKVSKPLAPVQKYCSVRVELWTPCNTKTPETFIAMR